MCQGGTGDAFFLQGEVTEQGNGFLARQMDFAPLYCDAGCAQGVNAENAHDGEIATLQICREVSLILA
jgi:hypothetical protein